MNHVPEIEGHPQKIGMVQLGGLACLWIHLFSDIFLWLPS